MESSLFTIIQKINKYINSLDKEVKEIHAHIKKQDLLIAYVFLRGDYDIEDFKKEQANLKL
jgi:hypothetical protein